MYGRILVPVDGSETSALGLDEAIKIAKSQGSQLRLVHVVNEFILDCTFSAGQYVDRVFEILREGGQTILDQAEAALASQGIKPDGILIESIGGRAADLILEQAREWGADLIVMGTHGRRGFMRLALGSDAETVVHGSTVPVMLVRGKLRAKSEVPASTPVAASAA